MYHDVCYLYKCIIVNCNKNNLKKIVIHIVLWEGCGTEDKTRGVSQYRRVGSLTVG